jgi:hypothetical protein
MALHSDIFWIGRQWAVTGFGIQAVDQRLRGVLDVAIARLWDDDFIASRRAKPGLNLEDFDKALSIARTRYPQAGEVAVAILAPEPPRAVEPAAAPPVPPPLALRAEGRLARFLPQWRVRR